MRQKAPWWLRRSNPFLDKLRSGQPATAMFVTVAWPSIVEVLGENGLDAVFIDLEHAHLPWDAVEAMVVAADAAGMSALVRPAGDGPSEIGRLLDCGAHGIVFPGIASADQASRARAATRFAPEGSRGWGGGHTRLAMWEAASAVGAARGENADQPFPSAYSAEFIERTGQDTAVVMVVEGDAGVRELAGIIESGAPSAVAFGWGDYSASVGFDQEATKAAGRAVYETARRLGMGVSIPVSMADELPFYPGCYYAVGVDSTIMAKALDERMAEAHAAITRAGR